MEVNNDKCVVQFSKLIEENVKRDNETTLVLSKETLDKIKAEVLVSAGLENNNHPNIKRTEKKLGFKTLIGLSLAFLMIVAGLVSGLIMMDMEIQTLKHQNQDLTLQNENQTKDLIKFDKIVAVFKNHSDHGLIVETKKGDVEAVKIFLEVGANPNGKIGDGDGRTLLYFAAFEGFIEIAELLIQYGANVNARNYDAEYETPLFAASHGNHSKLVEILLQNGAWVNITNRYEETALHAVVRWGMFEIIDLLLKHGANIDAMNHVGQTPLKLAIRHKQPKVVEILLNCGAKKDLRDESSYYSSTPLQLAKELLKVEKWVSYKEKLNEIIALLEKN